MLAPVLKDQGGLLDAARRWGCVLDELDAQAHARMADRQLPGAGDQLRRPVALISSAERAGARRVLVPGYESALSRRRRMASKSTGPWPR